MRQGGFKPKSHKSGVYWVRANAKNKKPKHKVGGNDNTPDINFLDRNGDGEISPLEWFQFCVVIFGVIFLFLALIIYEYSL